MDLIIEILLGLIGLFILAAYFTNRRPKNYPPGPFKWPLLGNMPQIALKVKNGAMHFLFEEYAKKYGQVVSVKLGSYDFVVLHDEKLIKEAWNHPQMQGRPSLVPAKYRTGGKVRGIIFEEGDEWMEQRRFAIRQLRDLGFGKKSMESLVTEEVQGLIEDLKKSSGQPISTQNVFNIAVVNSLWQITAGQRFERDDPELNVIIDAISKVTQGGGAEVLGVFMPWFAKLAPGLIGWKEYTKYLPVSFNFLSKAVKERLQTYDGDNAETFMDVFIDEIRKTKDPKSTFYGQRGELSLAATLTDLFDAGSETTSTTLAWMCLFLSLNPEKQKKVHQELDNILATSFPTLDDRNRLPYLEATILETLRFSSLVPLGLFHKTTADVQLGQYKLPKDTCLMANFHAVHFDEQIWGDPSQFRPERFLSEDGKSVVAHEGFHPFSYGKRICLGQTLAMQELYLFASNILQQFKVTWDPNGPKPTLDQTVRAVAGPLPHKLIFTERL